MLNLLKTILIRFTRQLTLPVWEEKMGKQRASLVPVGPKVKQQLNFYFLISRTGNSLVKKFQLLKAVSYASKLPLRHNLTRPKVLGNSKTILFVFENEQTMRSSFRANVSMVRSRWTSSFRIFVAAWWATVLWSRLQKTFR